MPARDEQYVFFDLETTPIPANGNILEFGAIVVHPKGWFETGGYASLVRNEAANAESFKYNGITPKMLEGQPTFAEIADHVHRILHGRVWVGHNIVAFDIPVLAEAFAKIGRDPPVPAGVLDTLLLVRRHFNRRAGPSNGMATLGEYFGEGIEKHRALADCRMTLEVMKKVAWTLFLEQNAANVFQ